MIVTSEGIPVKFTFTTGNKHDLDGIKQGYELSENEFILMHCKSVRIFNGQN